jgi:hypothetical protein
MQTNHNNRGILATARSIVQSQGVSALYKGVGPPLLSLSILNTVNFTSYSYFSSQLGSQAGWDFRHALAGGICGPLASTVSTVENLIKTQLQVDSTKQYKSSWDCFKALTRRHNGGLFVLYTGHGINTAREVAFLSTYFYTYEGLRDFLMHAVGHDGRYTADWAIPVAGGTAGAVAWVVSFPLDCVRAGVHSQDIITTTTTNNNSNKTKGSLEIARMLIQQRGIMGLYAGVTPSIVRAFLVSGSRFSAYELALWLLRGGRDNME